MEMPFTVYIFYEITIAQQFYETETFHPQLCNLEFVTLLEGIYMMQNFISTCQLKMKYFKGVTTSIFFSGNSRSLEVLLIF